MPIVSHSVQRGAVLGVHRLPFHVVNAATGDAFLPVVGKFRIAGVMIVPQVDQSAFTGCTARLFAPDGTTPITDALAVDVADGVQVSAALSDLSNNNIVDAEQNPLVLTVTNPGNDPLDMQVIVLYSTSLTNDAGAYTDYVLGGQSGTPIF